MSKFELTIKYDLEAGVKPTETVEVSFEEGVKVHLSPDAAYDFFTSMGKMAKFFAPEPKHNTPFSNLHPRKFYNNDGSSVATPGQSS